jgi:HicB family
MSSISLRLPESLHKKVREAAEKENVSINQWIAEALVDRLISQGYVEPLAARAARGDREKFHRILAKVPDVEPAEEDRL